MHDIQNRIADVLLKVEATLRINGKWDETRPSSSKLANSLVSLGQYGRLGTIARNDAHEIGLWLDGPSKNIINGMRSCRALAGVPDRLPLGRRNRIGNSI